MKRILNAEPYGYSEKAIRLWQEKGYEYIASSWDEIELHQYHGVQGLIVRLQRKIDNFILDKFPGLQFIISATTGWDHLDLDELRKRNIKLISLRGQDEFLNTIPSTAELTWGLLLALIRHIPQAVASVQKGEWNRDVFRGYQLTGKTLGVIGMGRTGRKMTKYARAFGMNIIYYDPFINQFPGVDKFSNLEELVTAADVVTLHVHPKEDTLQMINKEVLQHFKKGSYLLNTSRGSIWDENAVVAALTSQQLAGVAADVIASEFNQLTNSPLLNGMWAGQNIIITPHVGGATWDAMWQCEEYVSQLFFNKFQNDKTKRRTNQKG